MMNQRTLTLEHFHWQNNAGVSQRRFKIRKARTNWKMFLLDPGITSDHFEFTFKIHSYSGLTDNFCIGVCNPNHPTEKEDKNQYHGKLGGLGWGWWNESGSFNFPENKKPFKSCNMSGDLKKVGVVVNKKQKTLEFRRNGKNVRKRDKVFQNIDFPDVLHIAVSPRKKVDLELVQFKDHSPKPIQMMVPTQMAQLAQRLQMQNLMKQQLQISQQQLQQHQQQQPMQLQISQQQLQQQQQQQPMVMNQPHFPSAPMMVVQPQQQPQQQQQQQHPVKIMSPVSNFVDSEEKEQIKRRIGELENELMMWRQKLQEIENREKQQYGNVY